MARQKKILKIDGKKDNLDEITSSNINEIVNNGGKKNVRSIDELLGRKQNPYSVGTIEEYENQLKAMQLSDLERHATEMGSFPNANRTILINRLLEKFRKLSSNYYNSNQTIPIKPKNPAQLEKILGRIK